jgi:hypothetical protein
VEGVFEIPLRLSVLEDFIMNTWDELQLEKFCLEDGEGRAVVIPVLKNLDVVIVRSLQMGFHSFSESDAIRYANVTNSQISDEVFKLSDVSLAILDPLVATVVSDLLLRIKVFDLYAASEYTMREFISPILVAGVSLVDGVKMTAENFISGSLGNGPVDYDMIYKRFHVCVAEAKRENIAKGVVQNLAQIKASREAYFFSVLGKRQRDEFEVTDLPSSGIVSTGMGWIFTRYICIEGVWNFYVSNEIVLPLDIRCVSNTSILTCLKTTVMHIIQIIVGVLEYQKQSVDTLPMFPPVSKRQKMIPDTEGEK